MPEKTTKKKNHDEKKIRQKRDAINNECDEIILWKTPYESPIVWMKSKKSPKQEKHNEEPPKMNESGGNCGGGGGKCAKTERNMCVVCVW